MSLLDTHSSLDIPCILLPSSRQNLSPNLWLPWLRLPLVVTWPIWFKSALKLRELPNHGTYRASWSVWTVCPLLFAGLSSVASFWTCRTIQIASWSVWAKCQRTFFFLFVVGYCGVASGVGTLVHGICVVILIQLAHCLTILRSGTQSKLLSVVSTCKKAFTHRHSSLLFAFRTWSTILVDSLQIPSKTVILFWMTPASLMIFLLKIVVVPASWMTKMLLVPPSPRGPRLKLDILLRAAVSQMLATTLNRFNFSWSTIIFIWAAKFSCTTRNNWAGF